MYISFILKSKANLLFTHWLFSAFLTLTFFVNFVSLEVSDQLPVSHFTKAVDVTEQLDMGEE